MKAKIKSSTKYQNMGDYQNGITLINDLVKITLKYEYKCYP